MERLLHRRGSGGIGGAPVIGAEASGEGLVVAPDGVGVAGEGGLGVLGEEEGGAGGAGVGQEDGGGGEEDGGEYRGEGLHRAFFLLCL